MLDCKVPNSEIYFEDGTSQRVTASNTNKGTTMICFIKSNKIVKNEIVYYNDSPHKVLNVNKYSGYCTAYIEEI